MRTLIIVLGLISCLTITSFRMEEDTTCYINYSGIDSQGCYTTVVGTYDCSSPNPISTFSGTITLSGDGNCLNTQVVASSAIPDGNGGWTVPTGYNVAFYSDRMDDFCQSTSLTFIGPNANVVGKLNLISKSILDEFLTDMNC